MMSLIRVREEFARTLPGLILLFLGVPWLNPFVFGPTPSMLQWVVSMACLLALSLLWVNAQGMTDRAQWEKSLWNGWLAASLVSCLIGLAQYFGWADTFGPWMNTGNVGEAYGNLRQRNQFATLTNIGLAALIFGHGWRGLNSPPYPTHSVSLAGSLAGSILGKLALGKGSQLILAALVILAIGNAASNSRTGMAQLGLLLALCLVWRRPPKGMFLAIVVYGLAVALLPVLLGLDFLNSGLLGRIRENTAACASRLTLWSNVLHLIAQKPWMGWGWGELDYAHFMTLYPGERFCDILDNAHNLPLHIAVELGVPAALLFCSACAYALWQTQPWNEDQPGRQVAWAVLALIGLHSLLEYPLWYGPFQLAVLHCLGHLWCTRPQRTSCDHLFQSALNRNIGNAINMVLAGLLAYGAWDYWRVSQIYLPQSQRAQAYQQETLQKIERSWLFKDVVRFAELTTKGLDAHNALAMNALAKNMLHFSPEPRVVQTVIESAVLLGRDDEAIFYLQRFKAAFPQEHSKWVTLNEKILRSTKGPP